MTKPTAEVEEKKAPEGEPKAVAEGAPEPAVQAKDVTAKPRPTEAEKAPDIIDKLNENFKSIRWVLGAPKYDIIRELEEVATVYGKTFWFVGSDSKKNVPCLVCHIDTVHDDTKGARTMYANDGPRGKAPKDHARVYYDPENRAFWSPEGLGADDRAGVWGILRVRQLIDPSCRPHLLFCDLEEKGGQGARDAAKELAKVFSKVPAFVGIDRRGAKDCVFYNDEPSTWVKYVEGFGFEKATGSFSDVSTLGREAKVCSVNLSTGYYDQHMKTERLYIEILVHTIVKAKNLCQSLSEKGKRWDHEQKYKSWYDKSYKSDVEYEDGGYGDGFYLGCQAAGGLGAASVDRAADGRFAHRQDYRAHSGALSKWDGYDMTIQKGARVKVHFLKPGDSYYYLASAIQGEEGVAAGKLKWDKARMCYSGLIKFKESETFKSMMKYYAGNLRTYKVAIETGLYLQRATVSRLYETVAELEERDKLNPDANIRKGSP